MTMPFGKFKGIAVEDLPDGYLCWLAGEEVELRGQLAFEVQREYARRLHQAEPRSQGATIRIAPADVELTRLVVDRGYRAAALLFHPDHGGDPAMMVRLNNLAESLRGQLSALEAA